MTPRVVKQKPQERGPTKVGRSIYDEKFKLKVLKYANIHNIGAAAKKFSVPIRNIRRWKLSQPELKPTPCTQKSSTSTKSGRFCDLEIDIGKYVRERRKRGHNVTRQVIRMKALEMAAARNISRNDFVASSGWYGRFMRRHNLLQTTATGNPKRTRSRRTRIRRSCKERAKKRSSNSSKEAVSTVEKEEPDVDRTVPVQFEVINIPARADQWNDVQLDTASNEPIATTEKNICRLCIKNEGTVPIFQDDGHLRALAVQMMTISSVKVSSSDGLPSHVCNECVTLVHTCFNFKVQCEASDATLRVTLATSPAPPPPLVAAQVNLKDVDVDTTCNITSITNQLNETREKLNTLVASMKELQKQCRISWGRSSTSSVHAHTDSVNKTTQCSPVYEVVDITDDVEDCKSVVEIRDCLEFKGFNRNGTSSGCCERRKKRSHICKGLVGFSGVPCCYVVELDDKELEENCGHVGTVKT